MMQRHFRVWAVSLACLAGACGDEAPEQPGYELLDPQGMPYGKTYAEWASDWVRYIYSFAPPGCHDPLRDPTGAHCTEGQDPSSPVFFLVGSLGGPVTRRECKVPKGAALFFPLLNTWADTAGLPPEQQLSPADNKAYVEGGAAAFILPSMYARVDGQEIMDVQAGTMTEATPYELNYTEPNAYNCIGVEGVNGDFYGNVQGTWVMLAPLAPGKHVIEFGGRSKNDTPSAPDFATDTRYEFTVE
ncbi:MAG: hypothetical protein QM778_15815 [Myxococcales bacterium]